MWFVTTFSGNFQTRRLHFLKVWVCIKIMVHINRYYSAAERFGSDIQVLAVIKLECYMNHMYIWQQKPQWDWNTFCSDRIFTASTPVVQQLHCWVVEMITLPCLQLSQIRTDFHKDSHRCFVISSKFQVLYSSNRSIQKTAFEDL